MSKDSFKVKNGLTLTPIDPSEIVNPQAGDLIADSTDDNKIKKYDETSAEWIAVGGSGSGGGIPSLSKGSLITSDGTQNGELAVGADGQILSADSAEASGLKWIDAPTSGGGGTYPVVNLRSGSYIKTGPAIPNSYRSITASDDIVVIVSQNLSSNVGYSLNYGDTWSTAPVGQTCSFEKVLYANNVWIAVGANSSFSTNCIARSTDGVSWTSQNIAGVSRLYDVAFGNGVWVAVTYNGTNRTIYSTDNGVTWNTTPDLNSYDPSRVHYVDYLGIFLITFNSFSNYASSTDGINWTIGTLPSSGWSSIASTNNAIVMTQWSTANGIRSTDGINWTSITVPNSFQRLKTIQNMFIGGMTTSTSVSYYSYDGITWIAVNNPSTNYWLEFTEIKGRIIYMGGPSNTNVGLTYGLDTSQL